MDVCTGRTRRHLATGALVAGLATLFAAVTAAVDVPRAQTDVLHAKSRRDARLMPPAATATLSREQVGLAADLRDNWEAFATSRGKGWNAYVDQRTGQTELAEGPGIPWVPGAGNRLTLADLTANLGERKAIDLDVLQQLAEAFLKQHGRLLGIGAARLAFNKERSGHPADHLWYVDFDVYLGQLQIDGARVSFRVNNGNLVQFGSENLPRAGTPVPEARLTRDQAREKLATYVGGLTSADHFKDSGSLRLLPAASASGRFEPGSGRGLALVWQFVFTRRGVRGTWQARVDAVSGEVRELYDTDRYAEVSGGVFPVSPTIGPEIVMGLPFANLSSGGYTDSAGAYTYPGGAVSSTLNGQYVRINDNCGALSESSDALGNVAFGTSAGTDCTTPGHGGAGNTHSSRTQFYLLNRAKEAARTWLPGNAWLAGKLDANVNINDTCNAYWDGSDVNFFRSGGGCGNTGEIAAVALHEYGHGLDEHDGNGSSPDYGTGETYGDFTATLVTRTSCVGPGFRATNCSGNGDACTACTGVRDIDWAKHTSGTAHTVANFAQTHCPAHAWYLGPCGKEGHCESYVSSEALWDLAARDLPSPGSAAAWAIAGRLWYASRPQASAAFSCNTTGATWSSDGCAANSYWRTMRAADDDDGDLTNGTPHSCSLYAAFNRHGIACATDAGANVCHSGCTAPATPTLTVTPAATQNQLSWPAAGAGVVYDVYRSELTCSTGLLRIANDLASASYNDTAIHSHQTYYYQVVAHPAGNEACSSAPSTCVSVVAGVDLWSKDRSTDTGLEPDPATAGQPMWESPDIWVRNDASAGPHQNPINGQVNYVHIRIRNRGGVSSTGGTARLYFAPASSGLPWPGAWTAVGTGVTIPNLAGGADTEVVVPWTPSATGHYCLLSRIDSTQDPMTNAEVTSISTNVRFNNNVVWKNVNIVSAPPGGLTVQVLVRNMLHQSRRYRLVFEEVRPQMMAARPLLDHATIRVQLAPETMRRVTAPALRLATIPLAKITARGIPMTLAQSETVPVKFTVRPRPGQTPLSTPYLLRVIQVDDVTGEQVGGVTYEIHTQAQ